MYKFLAAGICMGLSSLGVAIGLGNAFPSLVSLFSEDKTTFSSIMIFLAFIETIIILAFVISVMLINA